MKFMFAGDLAITRPYNAALNVHSDLVEAFANSDCNIVNLEAPVTGSNARIVKTGPHLKAHATATLDLLKLLNIDVVALANNHIADYGEAGVLDTIEFLDANGFVPVGAGSNQEEASRPVFLETPAGSVAILNVAENEWASAGKESAGANGMDVVRDARRIRDAAAQCDYVFVVIHGGHEYFNLPSPRMREQYRFYAECGASLIVGHHSHCISGSEVHDGTPIFYSLGNFLFTEKSPFCDWYTGMALEVTIADGHVHTRLLPVHQDGSEFNLRLLDPGHDVLERVREYGRVLGDEHELELAWSELVARQSKRYLASLSPVAHIRSRVMRSLANRIIGNPCSSEVLLRVQNLVRCEAHLDLLRKALDTRNRRN